MHLLHDYVARQLAEKLKAMKSVVWTTHAASSSRSS